MDEKQPDKREPPPSAMDDLAEGFQTLSDFRARLTIAIMWLVPIVAVIYGAVAWKPYYLGLGLAALVLLIVLRRVDRMQLERPQHRKPPGR